MKWINFETHIRGLLLICYKKKRYKPPNKTIIYIVFNKKNAAVLKGTAAFFDSTDIYVLTPVFGYYDGVLPFDIAVLIKYFISLFRQITDKPHLGRPRCRSPPALLSSQF